jgi:predicted XRE-type DNA-binding protein
MKKANLDIRNTILKANLKQWEVAEKYGLSESNFSRLFRRELSSDKKKKIIDIITKLKKSNKE